MDKYIDQVQLVDDVRGVIDSFVVMRELSDQPLKGRFIHHGINSFNRNFIFKKRYHKRDERALIIKVYALKKEIIAEIDENMIGFNSSRLDVLKKYKRIVAVPGKQGHRLIHIPLKSKEDVHQILQDIGDWL